MFDKIFNVYAMVPTHTITIISFKFEQGFKNIIVFQIRNMFFIY